MSMEIDRRDIEDLMVPALRQYQHNDCSGLVAGYDLDETISIIIDIMKSARGKALEEAVAKHNQDQQEKLTLDQLKQTRGYQNADYHGINAIIWFKRGFEQAEKSYGIGGTK